MGRALRNVPSQLCAQIRHGAPLGATLFHQSADPRELSNQSQCVTCSSCLSKAQLDSHICSPDQISVGSVNRVSFCLGLCFLFLLFYWFFLPGKIPISKWVNFPDSLCLLCCISLCHSSGMTNLSVCI